MKTKKILIKILKNLSFFPFTTKIFFFIIGAGISLIFYNAYAGHTTYPAYHIGNYPSNGSTLHASDWDKLAENDKNFESRILTNNADIATLETATTTTIPNSIDTKATNVRINSLINCDWTGAFDFRDTIPANPDGRFICTAGHITAVCGQFGSRGIHSEITSC